MRTRFSRPSWCPSPPRVRSPSFYPWIVVPTTCMYVDIGLTSMYVCTSRWIARTKTRCMYVHVGWCSRCTREILISQVFVLVGRRSKNSLAGWRFRSHRPSHVPKIHAARLFRASSHVRFHSDGDGGGDGHIWERVATTCMCATRSPPA